MPKRKPGRPATGRDPGRTIRLSDELVAKIDRWAVVQTDPPSRSEAIRRLVETGLSHAPQRGRLSHGARTKASTMADEVIDRIADTSAPAKEQEKRKRRLIRGPLEFREMRQDQAEARPKPRKGNNRP
jgi:Arc/MetJ-type ribon-helix-helix transcriptional regulator